MPKANVIRAIVFVVIMSVFVFGVIHLFLLRFEAGDVYPPYSSLRSDPVGSRGFFNGLQNLRGITVRRNYRPLTQLESTKPVTIFYIGTPVFDADSVPASWVKDIQRLTADGGRLVLSFLPVEKKPPNWRLSACAGPDIQKPEKGSDPSPEDSVDADDNADSGINPSENASPSPVAVDDRQCVALKAQWGLTLAFAESPAAAAVKMDHVKTSTASNRLPQTISWHTAVYFDELDDNWRIVYTADKRPVVVERSYGNGSLMLSADSFFFSNEALRSERHAQLLAWAVGPNSDIVFDETHLGIRKHPGVLTLIKKYRFHWFIFSVAVLALLFVWKNSVYFVPPLENSRKRTGQGVSSNRDSIQGLISLLRRNIPTRQLLQTCAREWLRTFERHRRYANGRSDSIRSVFENIEGHAAQSNDPIVGYRRISKIISRGRHNE